MTIEINPMLKTAIGSLEAMERVVLNDPTITFGWFYGSRGNDALGFSQNEDGDIPLREYNVAIMEMRPWILSREPQEDGWQPHLISQHDFTELDTESE